MYPVHGAMAWASKPKTLKFKSSSVRGAPVQCIAAPGGWYNVISASRTLFATKLSEFLTERSAPHFRKSFTSPTHPQGPLLQLFSATTCEGTEIKFRNLA